MNAKSLLAVFLIALAAFALGRFSLQAESAAQAQAIDVQGTVSRNQTSLISSSADGLTLHIWRLRSGRDPVFTKSVRARKPFGLPPLPPLGQPLSPDKSR